MVDVSPFPRRTAAAASWWDARPGCQVGRLSLLTGSNLGMGSLCAACVTATFPMC